MINPRFTKPIDAGTHEFFGRAADVIVTLEDHVLMGGYGSSVLECLGDKNITTPLCASAGRINSSNTPRRRTVAPQIRPDRREYRGQR